MALNLALTPTGTLTKREQRKERFVAQYVGTYTVGAGRTSTEAIQTFITAAGTANTMLHSDIQMLLVTPKDPSTPIGGVSAIFDRNLNSNTVLGFDLSAPIPVCRQRRPAQLLLPTVRLDPNISSGTYVEAYSVGNDQHPLHPARQAHARRPQPGEGDRDDPRSDLHSQHRLHPPQRQYRSLSGWWRCPMGGFAGGIRLEFVQSKAGIGTRRVAGGFVTMSYHRESVVLLLVLMMGFSLADATAGDGEDASGRCACPLSPDV